MPATLTDAQIAAYLAEAKPITPDYRRWLNVAKMRLIGDNRQCSRVVMSTAGNKFGIHIRQNICDVMDFSVGMRLIPPSGTEVALVRCNGWHEEHRNMLDRSTPIFRIPENTCHVHIAQERYIAFKGPKKIGFAVATKDYKNIAGALEYLIDHFGFVSKKSMKPFFDMPLFPKDKK